MHSSTYRIYFLFVHASLDFNNTRTALSKIPELNAGRLMNAGKERVSRPGRKLKGKYFGSRWGFDFETTGAWRKSEEARNFSRALRVCTRSSMAPSAAAQAPIYADTI